MMPEPPAKVAKAEAGETASTNAGTEGNLLQPPVLPSPLQSDAELTPETGSQPPVLDKAASSSPLSDAGKWT